VATVLVNRNSFRKKNIFIDHTRIDTPPCMSFHAAHHMLWYEMVAALMAG